MSKFAPKKITIIFFRETIIFVDDNFYRWDEIQFRVSSISTITSEIDMALLLNACVLWWSPFKMTNRPANKFRKHAFCIRDELPFVVLAFLCVDCLDQK